MINKDKFREYDEKGNCIYSKYSFGYEFWNEYDENNNCIHSKSSDGYESWWKYDEKNRKYPYFFLKDLQIFL